MKNSADLGGCYPPRPSASVDNTLLYLQNSSYPTQPHSGVIIAKYLYSRKPVCRICTVENLFARRSPVGVLAQNCNTLPLSLINLLLLVFILTHPTGSSKYSITRKNIQRYYTPKHLIRYISSFETDSFLLFRMNNDWICSLKYEHFRLAVLRF